MRLITFDVEGTIMLNGTITGQEPQPRRVTLERAEGATRGESVGATYENGELKIADGVIAATRPQNATSGFQLAEEA